MPRDSKLNLSPSLIIFDVDGVLVDTRGSFQKTTLETVRFFTGKRVTRGQALVYAKAENPRALTVAVVKLLRAALGSGPTS